jgi:hypothetical protein
VSGIGFNESFADRPTRRPIPPAKARSSKLKPAGQWSPPDFTAPHVWEFADNLEAELPDETSAPPVRDLTANSLAGRVVGTDLTLANGQQRFGVRGPVDLADPVGTEHFLTVTDLRESGERFDLARDHDADYLCGDAVGLAAFLGLPIASVFPIRFDLTEIAVGPPQCLCRSIPAVPVSRWTQEELMALALKSGWVSTGAWRRCGRRFDAPFQASAAADSSGCFALSRA